MVIFFAFALIQPQKINAEEYKYYSENITDYGNSDDNASEKWDELISSLPEDIKSEVEQITPDNAVGSAEKLSESATLKYWLDKIFEEIRALFPQFLTDFAPLFILLIVSSTVAMILPNMISLNNYTIASRIISSTILFSMTREVINLASLSLSRICTYMNTLLPVMEAVSLASGELTSHRVQAASTTLALTLVGNFNSFIMTPLISALFTLSAVSLVAGDNSLNGIVSSFRNIINKLWQLSCLVYSFLFGVQTILARGSDDLAVRGVKFAIGSFVPVAGGMISDAYTTLREGMSFVKSVCGFGGILILILITLPTVLPLFLYKICLSLTKSASEILKCDTVTPIMSECLSTLDFILGVVLSVELIFVLSVLMFSKAW